MRKWLLTILVILTFDSFCLNAMDNSDYSSPKALGEMLKEVVGKVVHFDVQDFLHATEVCRAWYLCLDDDFFKVLYEIQSGRSQKLRPDLNYKANCKIINMARVVCHTADNCRFAIMGNYVNTRVKYEEEKTANSLSKEECRTMLASCLVKKPHVFGDCFAYYKGGNEMDDYLTDALTLAKTNDVIIVFPVGNDRRPISNGELGYDLHAAYPNVMWAAACNDDLIADYSNFGELANIAAPSDSGTSSGTSQAVLFLAEFLGYLRALRMELTAQEICFLVNKAAKPTEKIPNGGILDCKAAIEAVTAYVK